MQYKITIPEPCRQNWDNMIPGETGRYCNSCKRSVVDFTPKTDEEIQQFIINNSNQKLCGRFKSTQVARIIIDLPENILSIQMPLWMRFLVACLLIFGISIFPFETTVAGKTPAEISQDSAVAFKSAGQVTKTKKRKKKKNKNIFHLLSAGITVGWVNIKPDISLLDTLPGASILLSKKSSAALDRSTHLATGDKSIPQKEQPRPTPYLPTEFILPSVLLFRKENNNETMD